MEAKKSMAGRIIIPRHIKRAAIKKLLSENMKQGQEFVDWVYETYQIKISAKIISSWLTWYREDQEGRSASSSVSPSSSGRPSGTVWWIPEEDAEVTHGFELGLSSYQIAECMSEDEELNYRNYTTGSINSRKSILGLRKYPKPPNNTVIEKTRKLLLEAGQTLVEYTSARRIRVKCNKCDHEWIKTFHLPIRGCPTCLIPPNSYYEVYLIEFSNFGNPSVKLGISADYWNSRRKTFPEHTTVEVYQTTFQKAIEIEILVAEKFGEYRTSPPELHKNGITECYDISQTEEINKLIKEQLHDKNSTN